MNRRTVLGALGAAAVGLAGCQADGTPWPTTTPTPGHCPPTGHVSVFLPEEIPTEESVVDAEREGFTENRYLARALARASEKYEPEMAAGDSATHLVTVSGEDVYYSDVDEYLDDWDAYVRYEGVVYEVRYGVVVC